MSKIDAMIVAFIGPAGSGKDTAAAALLGDEGAANLKFASPLKDICSQIFGWDRYRIDTDLSYKEEVGYYCDGTPNMNKQGTPQTRRQILQLVGTDLMRNQVNDDVWLQAALQTVSQRQDIKLWVVTDARFTNEIEFLRSNFRHVLVVRLTRLGGTTGTEAHTHISEMQSSEIVADEHVSALDGDVNGLQVRSCELVDEWILESLSLQ